MEKVETFGKYLRKLRENRGLTLRKVGEIAGLDYVWLNKVELGLRMPPNLEGIIAIADAMELEPAEFEKLLDLAAQENGRTGARFTSDEVQRIKDSTTADAFFTRRERQKGD